MLAHIIYIYIHMADHPATGKIQYIAGAGGELLPENRVSMKLANWESFHCKTFFWGVRDEDCGVFSHGCARDFQVSTLKWNFCGAAVQHR